MIRLVVELITLIVGAIVFSILFIVGLVYTFIKHVFLLDYSPPRQLIPVIRSVTLILDGLANSGAGEFLNDVLKVSNKAKIRYGKWYQTISAVTGMRYLFNGVDNNFRRTLDKVIGKDHCKEAISDEDLFYHENNK